VGEILSPKIICKCVAKRTSIFGSRNTEYNHGRSPPTACFPNTVTNAFLSSYTRSINWSVYQNYIWPKFWAKPLSLLLGYLLQSLQL